MDFDGLGKATKQGDLLEKLLLCWELSHLRQSAAKIITMIMITFND
nr:MAG TPA: hypothetical protein [Caudoviricetes sp.]